MERQLTRSDYLECALNLSCIIKQNVSKQRERLWVWEGENGLPHIHEFLIFGSVAQRDDEEFVGDLDMILIDNGHYSHKFPSMSIGDGWDWYNELKDNVRKLLLEIFADEGDVARELAMANIDLHILPLKFFKNLKYRKEIADQHKDPDFFHNCFSSMLRLEGFEFVPVSLGYFERKYRCNLSDIR